MSLHQQPEDDQMPSTYKIKHPAINKVIEYDSDGNITFTANNLSNIPEGDLCFEYQKTAEPLTSLIKAHTVTERVITVPVTPVPAETMKYYDNLFFDSRFFE